MLCPGWLAGGMLGGEGEGHTVSIHLPTDRRRRRQREEEEEEEEEDLQRVGKGEKGQRDVKRGPMGSGKIQI